MTDLERWKEFLIKEGIIYNEEHDESYLVCVDKQSDRYDRLPCVILNISESYLDSRNPSLCIVFRKSDGKFIIMEPLGELIKLRRIINVKKDDISKDIYDILRLYKLGYTTKQLAIQFNRKHTSIKKIIDKYAALDKQRDEFMTSLRLYLIKSLSPSQTNRIHNALIRHTDINNIYKKEDIIDLINSDTYIRGIGINTNSRSILKEFAKTV